jgi:glycosyltransferase involved in cell wall biosynthesis
VGKPRIVILDNSIAITGALNAILAFADNAKNDFCFYFILPSGSKAADLVRKKGFKVKELPFLELGKSWRNLFFYIPTLLRNALVLRRLIRKEEIKIVHVNDFYNMVGIVTKVLGGRFQLLTHARFMPNRFPALLVWCWMRLNLRYAEKIICVSQAVKRLLEEHAKIIVIYDGLAVPDFTPKEPTNQTEEISLLYLANYIPGKGQNYALEAFSLAFRYNPNLRMRFVGGDMGLLKNRIFKEKLKQRAKKLLLTNVITFSGVSTNPFEEYNNCDIVLNFSESESFSMTGLEALMQGKPLIITDCGGPAELLIHRESGFLVPNRDTKAMKNAIIELSENQVLRERLSKNSVKYAVKKFSLEKSLVSLKDTYKELLAQSRKL